MKVPPDVAYQLRVAAEEIEAMRGEIRLGNLPHIKAFLQNPGTQWGLTRIQELLWTWERISRRTPPQAASKPVVGTRIPGPVPDLWLDVTNSHRSGFKGGVARVALKLAESASRNGQALPVVMRDGKIFAYSDADENPVPLSPGPDTIFVIVDTFWRPFDEYLQAIERVREGGGRSVLCVHDVIAIDYPLFFDVVFARDFRARLAILLREVDACVAVSNATLLQVRDNFEDHAAMPMGSFRLGADFDETAAAATPQIRPVVRRALDRKGVFVSVGTLEPRKGYVVSLDAFDILWAAGLDCTLVIFGQKGWICNALEKRILEHAAYNERLFWFADASDAELKHAYRAAHCLIQASVVEGFGLPIVEACRERTPVIASDVEIFREVGQNRLIYFKTCDSADLARAIRDVLRARPVGASIDVATWDQSLAELAATVRRLLPPSPFLAAAREPGDDP